jgi:[ribosomal protein S5]-alanine N-acetyltransferase
MRPRAANSTSSSTPTESCSVAFELIRCAPDGQPVKAVAHMPAELVANCQGTAELYRRVGYLDPWVGYIALDDGRAVGGGAFVGAPQDRLVEIAYFTLKDEERKGYAGNTARGLMDIARRSDPLVRLKAFTLMQENASTRILTRLGFKVIGTAQDPDAGEVWEWRA